MVNLEQVAVFPYRDLKMVTFVVNLNDKMSIFGKTDKYPYIWGKFDVIKRPQSHIQLCVEVIGSALTGFVVRI